MREIIDLGELSNPVAFLDWLIEHDFKIRMDERNKTIDIFTTKLKLKLTNSIHQKDVEKMEYLINDGVWSTKSYQGGLSLYPCSQDGSQIVKKLGETGSRYNWWTASADSGNSAYFVYVDSSGYIGYSTAFNSGLSVPHCKRDCNDK